MTRTPQLEDGFVRIANELLEAILGFDFSHREQSVVLTIIRKTYGYGKKEDDISAAQIGDMCGMARTHVTNALNLLAQRNVIIKRTGRFGSIIGIQKDHRKWISRQQLKSIGASTESVQGCTELVHVPNQYVASTESVQVASTESVHTKDNLPKDNHQKKSSCAPLGEIDPEIAIPAGRPGRATTDAKAELQNRFERFYAAYPRKRSRQAAEKAFAKINPDEQLLAAMIAGIGRAMTSGEWTDSQFIPHPASWLNAGGWQDEIQTGYSEDELTVIDRFNEALGDRLGHVQTTPFVAERAGAIRAFTTFSAKPGFVDRFFPWAGANVEFPPSVGFDWLISPKGYTNATSGQHSKK
ncbi:MAG: replication protein [Pseudomonadota bacterium]|nr:replication protein [Pseudomonadota bacterium]